MANYLIGLDFGTSQTKVCVFNQDLGTREFVKFENNSFFLPSLITKKEGDLFSYGEENTTGIKYRYFKMAAAEDENLIQVTNEDIDGELANGINNYKKYSENTDIEPEFLVVLYLTYIYIYIKNKTEEGAQPQIGGLLGRMANNIIETVNSYSINLGIPTEWNSPDFSQRKIKFQSLLLTAVKLAENFNKLDDFLKIDYASLKSKILSINKDHLTNLKDNQNLLNDQLKQYKLSVFPESAAGVNYLLQTNRLTDIKNENETKYFATLDIGAGTSDIAIFKVRNNQVTEYYCSESIEIASNDIYKEYAKLLENCENINYNTIKQVEIEVRNKVYNIELYNIALKTVKGRVGIRDGIGLQFAIRRIFYRKFYLPTVDLNQQIFASNVKNNMHESDIIVYGGGSNYLILARGVYCYYPDPIDRANYDDKYFNARPITDFILGQVDIINSWESIKEHINMLILALGLTYRNENDAFNFFNPRNLPEVQALEEPYPYYDIQSAVY